MIDLYALYGLVFTDPVRVIGFWLAFNAAQLVVAIVAFRLDREPLGPLWALPLQQRVYRQLMYLVIIESTISALVGARGAWKHIPAPATSRSRERRPPNRQAEPPARALGCRSASVSVCDLRGHRSNRVARAIADPASRTAHGGWLGQHRAALERIAGRTISVCCWP